MFWREFKYRIGKYFEFEDKNLKNFLESRERLKKSDFIENSHKEGFSKIVAEHTYIEVVKYLNFVDSPNIYLEDDFVEDYNFLWEDFENVYENVLDSLNMEYPNESEIKYFHKQKNNSHKNRIIDIIEAVDFYRNLRAKTISPR